MTFALTFINRAYYHCEHKIFNQRIALKYFSSGNYYDQLGVDRNASAEEIRKSFITKSKEYHPDKNKGDAEKFIKMKEAYDVLSNEMARKNYDKNTFFERSEFTPGEFHAREYGNYHEFHETEPLQNEGKILPRITLFFILSTLATMVLLGINAFSKFRKDKLSKEHWMDEVWRDAQFGLQQAYRSQIAAQRRDQAILEAYREKLAAQRQDQAVSEKKPETSSLANEPTKKVQKVMTLPKRDDKTPDESDETQKKIEQQKKIYSSLL